MQRTQFEDLIQSLARSRDENVLADLEAAIRVAQQQSGHHRQRRAAGADTLKQADERLARYNQPRLERVRRAVAQDLERATRCRRRHRHHGADDPARRGRSDVVDDLPLLSATRAALCGARRGGAARATGGGVLEAPVQKARRRPLRRAGASRSVNAGALSQGYLSGRRSRARWCASRASSSLKRCWWRQSRRSSCARTSSCACSMHGWRCCRASSTPRRPILRDAQAALDRYFDRRRASRGGGAAIWCARSPAKRGWSPCRGPMPRWRPFLRLRREGDEPPP